ncbi:MAG: hypothetical protein GY750_16850 [Lentisphaerae bacterium]|nr:hypothetical protein [Lentisphaerota bacterium]MCP4103066.1 hypothetical protein [Lentisphaerota bacterium]
MNGAQTRLFLLNVDSIEHYTGEETLKFIRERDESRPFFIHMSFQRPHAPISPSEEFYNMYDPDKITLPDSSIDWIENKFAGKPEVLRKHLMSAVIHWRLVNSVCVAVLPVITG